MHSHKYCWYGVIVIRPVIIIAKTGPRMRHCAADFKLIISCLKLMNSKVSLASYGRRIQYRWITKKSVPDATQIGLQ
jgi:hypothetical protein